MTRWKAAGSHLALSILVVGGIAVTAFLLWYPHALYKVSGLDRILLVMLGIDLTAGPLLTLILYRPGKWGLKFDLTAVAIAQILFLSYGLHTLWEGRPVFLVGTPDTFTVVFANEIDPEDLALAPRPEWRSLSWTGPRLVAARMPPDGKARQQIIEEFMAGGAGIERSPKYYQTFAKVAPEILERSSAAGNEEQIPDSDVRASGLPRAQLRTLPVVSRRGEGVMLIRAENATPVRVSSLPPS